MDNQEINNPQTLEEDGIKKRIRNLHQYKNLSDEEFEEIYEQITNKTLKNKFFEKRIKEKLDEFGADYDITDLKINDRNTLRALVQATLSLEDFEQVAYKLQREILGEEEDSEIVAKLEKVHKMMNTLRNDISRMQEDLKITRRIRKEGREESVMAYIENIKTRAKKFYESRVARVFCPNCNLLIGSVWVLYPDSNQNKFWFYCKRCDEKVIINYPDLVKNGLKNIDNVVEF